MKFAPFKRTKRSGIKQWKEEEGERIFSCKFAITFGISILLLCSILQPSFALTTAQAEDVIDDGLEWLKTVRNADGQSWAWADTQGDPCVAMTAFAVLAFINRYGRYDGAVDKPEWTDWVVPGLDYILSRAQYRRCQHRRVYCKLGGTWWKGNSKGIWNWDRNSSFGCGLENLTSYRSRFTMGGSNSKCSKLLVKYTMHRAVTTRI